VVLGKKALLRLILFYLVCHLLSYIIAVLSVHTQRYFCTVTMKAVLI